ncbi:SCO3374 family protein [Streptomyces sp. NPDC058676]|uniref:SCO3374 family protein n=1 Tax=unclassified Streptomyces TaxID=2593676 RepID=UPI00364E841D
MVGTLPPVPTELTSVPRPRRPLDSSDQVRRWYENELGWPTVPAHPESPGDQAPGTPGGPPRRPETPVRLSVGLRFDVLDVPAEAGHAALRHLSPGSPVALQGDRMRLLVAAGSAEELPGVLDWLEWGALTLDLTAIGEGGVMDAPLPPGRRCSGAVQGAAVWLRPPEPGYEVEASLPTLSAVGGGGNAPDLARVVDTMAAQCHRLRLRRACARQLACW